MALARATVGLLERAGESGQRSTSRRGSTSPMSRQVARAFAEVEMQHGSIDILVNNAGRANRKPAVELTREEWQAVLDLNLTAVFLCSRTAMPYMKKRGAGSIVNLASIMGFSGGIFPNASYQATKGARRQPDARAGARMGAGQHPRQRRGADLRAHRPDGADLLQSGSA